MTTILAEQRGQKVVFFDEAATRSNQAWLSLTKFCDVCEVARCSYYRRLGVAGSRVRKVQELGDCIKRIQATCDGRYGNLRMTVVLKEDGHERKPGHNQVARIMRKIGCQAVVRRACTYRVHCKKGQHSDGTVLENVLDRKFEKPKPRTAFVTDVTYIPVKEGWLYVSPVIDLCTREVVVCEMSICQDMNLALKRECPEFCVGVISSHHFLEEHAYGAPNQTQRSDLRSHRGNG